MAVNLLVAHLKAAAWGVNMKMWYGDNIITVCSYGRSIRTRGHTEIWVHFEPQEVSRWSKLDWWICWRLTALRLRLWGKEPSNMKTFSFNMMRNRETNPWQRRLVHQNTSSQHQLCEPTVWVCGVFKGWRLDEMFWGSISIVQTERKKFREMLQFPANC